MSTTVDQRVVEMQFDNRNFERNVSNTMSTLDKLKQSLRFTGATKGFEDVSAAAGRVNMSGLGTAVETVGLKFSAMYSIADQALRNITNSAMATGKKIVSALTIDPIKTGFSEYETQINAVQTILANTESKGTTLGDVNRALDELNTYADKTIYNFTEMTKNIGTFTAAGIDLDTSVNAIQGIANLAAVSGSTSQQASTAMYQLSQALSSGTVKLMDWNSVVNAGMGGQVFQDALKETARVHGIAIDDMIKNEGSFRETLKDGWLTSEILTETLSKFTMSTEGLTEAQIEQNRQTLKAKGYTDEQIESIFKLGKTATNAATKVKTFTQLWDTLKESAQSGWTQTWEIVVGDFEEAKELLTKVSDTVGEMIGKSSDRRNSMLSEGLDSNWKKLVNTINDAGIETSAFEEKIRKIVNDDAKLDALIAEHGTLANVFKDGALSSDILSQALDGLSKSTADLSVITGELKKGNVGEEVKQAQQALSDLGYDLGSFGIDGSFGKATEQAVRAFQEANKLEVTGIIDEATLAALKEANVGVDGLSESCKSLIDNITELGGRENIIKSLWNVFDGLMSIVKPIGEAFREIFPPITGEQLFAFTEKLKEFTSKLVLSEEQAAKLKSTFKGIFSVISLVVNTIVKVGSGVLKVLGRIFGFTNGILSATGSLGDWISELCEGVKETNVFGKAIDKVTDFLTKGIDKIKEFGKSIKESFAAEGYSGFVGFLKLILDLIKSIGSAFSKAFGSITSTLSEVFSGFNLGNLLNVGLTGGILLGVKKVVSTLKEILDSGGGFLENFKETISEFKDSVLDCFGAFQNNLNAQTLTKIATAIALLAASILLISFIDPAKLNQSLGAIAVLFVELIGAMKAFTMIDMKGLKGVMKAATLITSMSVAILILAGAMKTLSSIDPSQMLNGVLAIGILMGEMMVFLKYADMGEKMVGSATGIVLISSAMLILAKAVASFANMEWVEIGKGVASIGALLGILSVFTRIAGKAEHVAATGFAMIMLGTAMNIFAHAVKSFANMEWAEIGRGLAGMAGALAAVTMAMRFMPNEGMISSGAGLVIVAASLLILSKAMKSIAEMDRDALSQGILGMGFALLTIAVALKAMQGSIAGSAALIIAASALAVIAPVLKTLGNMSGGQIAKSLIALAGAFVVIGVAGAVLAPVVGTIALLGASFALLGVGMIGIGAGITLIATGIAALAAALSVGATAIVAALSAIIIGIADLIPQVARKIGEGIVEIAKVLGEYAPQLAESILVLIVEVFKSLADHIPVIVEVLFDLVIGIIDALAVKMPELMQSVVNLIMSFFQGVVDALSGIDTDALLKGIVGIGLISALMFALGAVATLVPAAMIGVLGMGLVIAELALVLAAIGAFAQIPGLEWLIGEGGDFLQKIGTAIGQFIGGIAGGIAEGVSASLPQLGTDLSTFMTNIRPFIEGAKSIDASMMEGVQALAKTILLLTAADLVEGLTSWLTGGSSLADFGEQLAGLGTHMRTFVTNLGTFGPDQVTAVSCAAAAISAIAEASKNIPNEGGWLGKILGENSLATFGEKLPTLGTHLKGFVTNLGAFGAEQVASVKNAASAIAALADVADDIPNEGGWVAALFGDNGLAAFGEKLPKLGSNIADYAANIGDINLARMSGVLQQIKNLVLIAQNMIGVDFSVFEDFADGIKELGKADIEDFIEAFKDGTDSAVTTMTELIDAMLSAAEDKGPEFSTMGRELSAKLGDGADDSKAKISVAFALVLSDVVTTIRNGYIKFYQAGAFLVTGFANGISQNTYKAKAKAQAMASAAAEAAAAELDEHSPSRVGYRIGDYFGIAFVNGIGDWVSKAYETSAAMASSAREGLGSAISKVAGVVESDIDTNPTIRPIMDLSDVQSGVKTMDGLLNRTASVGVLADVSSISYAMNRRSQNGTNSDVVSAIGKLGDKMDGVRGNTYNLNGISYNDGTDLAEAIQTIVRYAQIERRV